MESIKPMSSYKELLAQKAKLEEELIAARKREISDAVSRVRELVAEYELTPSDVFPGGGRGRARSGSRGSVAPKYRNPETGETWSGRGRSPNWLKGKKRESFLIAN
jgi:DNA-binding protein H-NS